MANQIAMDRDCWSVVGDWICFFIIEISFVPSATLGIGFANGLEQSGVMVFCQTGVESH
jgi:hypothetical protein